jgi:preprotein translocase subunit YajC
VSGSDLGIVVTGAPADGAASPFVQLVPFLVIFAVFYFLVFAPMRKKQKTQSEMLRNLKAGDKVVTSGGIYGVVVGVTEHVVQLRIADQVKIDVSKSAVAGLQSPDGVP